MISAMIAQVNIPIFSSEKSSIGSAVGRIHIESMPDVGDLFPWPEDWLEKLDPVLRDHFRSMIVVYVDGSPQIGGVQLAVEVEGAFLSSESEARKFVAKLENSAGFIYSNYFS